MGRTRRRPKPAHLGPTYGAQFRDGSVARAYPHRPPYAAETIDVLVGLAGRPDAARVLDAGCGTGDLARPLAARVCRVDAVDPSAAMIAVGRSRPGGERPSLRWREAPMESAALDGPYDLITAAESVHWMDWDVVFPRFDALLGAHAQLAIVERCEAPPPWNDDLRALIGAYSTNRDYEPYDILDELGQRGLFEPTGRHETRRLTITVPADAHVECMHSRNGFSRDRMGARAADFDAAYRALLARHGAGEAVTLTTWDAIAWGRPGAAGHA